MKKVAIYVRVSTTNQAEEGYSIEEQKSKLAAYCEVKDWKIHDIYTDGGFTGSNTERPALEKLVKEAKAGLFDTVLVYKLDRLSRSQKDTLYLIEDVFMANQIDFVSLLENFDTSTPFGKAMVGILSVFAQLEREQIKERMQLGKIGRAKAGKSMMWSRVSYGYDYHEETGEMTVNHWQAIAIKSIFDWYLSGKSITKIRDALNDAYGEDKGGKVWSYRTVRLVLGNPVYCGYNQYKGEVYPGNHEPIISKEVFDRTQKELKIRQRTNAELSNPRPFQAKYMLSGIGQCGYCGSPLKIIMGAVRKDGTRFIRYECYQRHPRKTKGVTVYNNNERCHSGYYDKQELEEFVISQIQNLQNDPTAIEELTEYSDTEEIDHEVYQKQIEGLQKKIERLNNLYIDGHITLEELKKRASDFKGQKQALEEDLDKSLSSYQKSKKEALEEVLGANNVILMDYEEKKTVVRSLVDKIKVTADEIVIKWRF